MAELEQEEKFYEPEDAIARGTTAGLVSGAAGLLLSAAQNTVAKQNVGMLGIFTKFGGTTATFASVGLAYGFTSAATANLREKKDMWSHATGGFFAGCITGLRRRAVQSVLGNGLALATIMAVIAFTQDTYNRSPADADEARQARKDEARKRFRRPLNELVNEIGEGRGIYPPGYDERRKQRIKERYGIDIQEPYYKDQPANE